MEKQTMDNIQTETNWQDTPNDAAADTNHELSELDKLCFTCPLTDCKSASKKCPINIAKTK